MRANHIIIAAVLYYASVLSAINILEPTVQKASAEYSRLLNHSMLFFEAQRAGKLPANNRVSWRHDSALMDGSADNIDLVGGYYDAGNYLKFTFPLCYSVFILSWGGSDYIRGYELANQTAYFKDQIKWATDWLIKAHPEPSTLYVQVGDIKRDSNYFGPDVDIPEPRPAYKITKSNFGTDAAAIASAAFSGASVYFRTLSERTQNEEDEKYADTLLVHAQQLFDAAIKIFPYTRYHESIDVRGHNYSSSGYMDDLILSGISLYRATKDQTVLDKTLQIYRENERLSKHTEPLDWDNKWGAVYILLAEVLLDYADQQEARKSRVEAENYLDDILKGNTANKTKGGLLYWNEYSDMNSNSIAMSTSHLLLSYSCKILRPLATTANNSDAFIRKANEYEELAKSQLFYIFGKNPAEQNYIVGERLNSPKYPHSATASGFLNLKDASENSSSLENSHVIYGALVGGPAKDDSFTDNQFDWSQTEVALDYNAPYQNVLAYQVMFSNEEPFYMTEVDNNDAPTVRKKFAWQLNSWQFALVVALPTLLFLGLTLGYFAYWKHRQRRELIRQEQMISAYRDRRRSESSRRRN